MAACSDTARPSLACSLSSSVVPFAPAIALSYELANLTVSSRINHAKADRLLLHCPPRASSLVPRRADCLPPTKAHSPPWRRGPDNQCCQPSSSGSSNAITPTVTLTAKLFFPGAPSISFLIGRLWGKLPSCDKAAVFVIWCLGRNRAVHHRVISAKPTLFKCRPNRGLDPEKLCELRARAFVNTELASRHSALARIPGLLPAVC